MKTAVIVWGLFILILSVPAQAYQERREFSVGAAGIETMKITCDAGNLIVTGNAGTTDILVKADIEIKAKNAEKALKFAREQIELQLLENGREAHLKSLIGEKECTRGPPF